MQFKYFETRNKIWFLCFSLLFLGTGILFQLKFGKIALLPFISFTNLADSFKTIAVYLVAFLPVAIWNYKNTPLPFFKTILFNFIYVIIVQLMSALVLTSSTSMPVEKVVQKILEGPITFEFWLALFLLYFIMKSFNCMMNLAMEAINSLKLPAYVLFSFFFILTSIGLLCCIPPVFVGLFLSFLFFDSIVKKPEKPHLKQTLSHFAVIFIFILVIYIYMRVDSYNANKAYYEFQEITIWTHLLKYVKEVFTYGMLTTAILTVPDLIAGFASKFLAKKISLFTRERILKFLVYGILYSGLLFLGCCLSAETFKESFSFIPFLY